MMPILVDFPETATGHDVIATAKRLRASDCTEHYAGWTLNYLLRDLQPEFDANTRLQLINALLELEN